MCSTSVTYDCDLLPDADLQVLGGMHPRERHRNQHPGKVMDEEEGKSTEKRRQHMHTSSFIA